MLISSSDSSNYRAERLQKTIKIAKAITGLTDHQIDTLIAGIHDERGTLLVTWETEHPSEFQKNAFKTAWECVGESRITHEVQA